jgi:dimethylamine corrinoid protein
LSETSLTTLEKLAAAVVAGSEEQAVAASREAIDRNLDATEAIIRGLAGGMEIVGQYYESQKYFLTEVVMASTALNAGVAVLKPHIKVEAESRGSVVLGTVQGDTHDIGKRIVAIMLGAAGYEIHDAGRDVPPERFIELVKETGADVLGLSALMTTSMVNMKTVIEVLSAEGLRDSVKVVVGGAPISRRFAKEIGADGYAANAHQAIKVVDELLAKVGTAVAV